MTSRTIALVASVLAAALFAGSPALANHAKKSMCSRVESARAQGKSDPEIAKSLKLSDAQVKGCTKKMAAKSHAANPSTNPSTK